MVVNGTIDLLEYLRLNINSFHLFSHCFLKVLFGEFEDIKENKNKNKKGKWA